MTILAVSLAMLVQSATADGWHRTDLKSAITGGLSLAVGIREGVRTPAKVSPLHGWKFDSEADLWLPDGSVRIRAFGDTQRLKNALVSPAKTASFLGLLYDFNVTKLHIDHSPLYGDQKVDVYLCSDGEGGGEQAFGADPDTVDGSTVNVNTIYVYEVGTLGQPIEACRELAHEYGHASLPAVKVPGAHEEWANGDVGERLFLMYLSEALKSKRVTSQDLFGASAEDIASYLLSRVDPLVQAIVVSGPSSRTLSSHSQAAEDQYLGMVCLAYRALPIEVFRRSLVLNPDQSPAGYNKALLEAIEERESIAVRPPQGRDGTVWIPLGKCQLHGAKVVATRDGWAKVRPSGDISLKGTG